MKIIKSLMPYIIIIIVVILVRTFIATPVRVNGSSMYPTLKGNEIMLLNKLGQIKRIIGLPGETVEIKDNDIYINDKKIEDKYGYGVTYNIDKVTLKKDEYFILGDNRKISLDSRVFGTIHKDEIKGTTDFIMYPFKSFGKVK